MTRHQVTLLQRIGAVLAYGCVGFVLIFSNKIVLTVYKFPSFNFLALSQIFAVTLLVRLCKHLGVVTFPDFSVKVMRDLFPIPLLYFADLVSGLGATQRLNLPMFVVLRRIGIPITLLLEFLILKIRPTSRIVGSIVVIVGGSVVAAAQDLAFDLYGYVLILVYDLCGALNGVCIKKKLDETTSLGRVGVLYYCCLFSVVPISVLCWVSGDFHKAFDYEGWSNAFFLLCFLSSTLLGYCQLYCWILCTEYNSPLMTQVVSSMRSVLVTYIGMFVGRDYIFDPLNFVGLNISILGGFCYTYFSFTSKKVVKEVEEEEDEDLRLLDVQQLK